MRVPQLLLRTLEDLVDENFSKLKWYLTLNILDEYSPIPTCYLSAASRCETVSLLMDRYGGESAVRITLEVLRRMGSNNAAERLKAAYAASLDEGRRAPAAAPAAFAPRAARASAQDGRMVITENVTRGSSISWNVTINK